MITFDTERRERLRLEIPDAAGLDHALGRRRIEGLYSEIVQKTSIRLVVVLLPAALIAMFGSTGSAQTPATGRVMREKLGHSQKILEAILTSNFALLERESAALAKATDSPAWTVLKGPEYMKQSDAFLKALRDLSDAAKGHDLDAAAQRYNALTTSCFGCHRSMKDRRLAARP
jgi:hypothetical protein